MGGILVVPASWRRPGAVRKWRENAAETSRAYRRYSDSTHHRSAEDTSQPHSLTVW